MPLAVCTKSKIIRYSGIFLCVAALIACVMRSDNALSQQQLVRVAILKEAETLTISIRGAYKISDPKTNQVLASGKRLGRSKVKKTPNGIMIADQIYFADRLRISAKKDVSIYLNEKKLRYRGQIDFVPDLKNKFLVINALGIEDYVKGVLYHEVPHDWPLTAIKAQAVATRTYVLYQLSQKVKEKYDVTSDIYSQVYGGRSAERYRSNIASNRTRGEVLTFNGKVLPAYFSSTCGGQTENVSELWKHDLLPLKGVKCRFCALSPHYRWKKNFRSKDIQDQLNANGFKIGMIKEIDVTNRTENGRVKNIKITTRDGTSTTKAGTRFREIIGPNIIKSNLYDVDMKGYYFDLIGRGWGHGVGMCQWGAYQMARDKYKYTSIMEHYYPGTKIIDMSQL
jgi:stage II sporulation protein D